jgi:hypothetical protein
MESMFGSLSAMMGQLGPVLAVGFVAAAYFFASLDRGRENSPVKDDTQLGLKLVLFGIAIAGVQLIAGGTHELLAFMLSGFKGGSVPIRQALPPILVGALALLVIFKMMLPRTNASTAKQAERYAVGFLGLQFGVIALSSVSAVVSGLFAEAPWAVTSNFVAATIVNGGLGFFTLTRFGGLSGWTAPVAPPPPAMPQGGQGYPPQGGGYPPQGGGYPPQGGGYPPQGGGYPPQGGGYPPQGGGYPPQGGGYPPQGGGYGQGR